MKTILTHKIDRHRKLTQNDSDWLYNGLDCCVTLEVYNKLSSQLDKVSAATYDFSKSLQAPLLEMSIRGVLIDKAKRERVLTETCAAINRVSLQLARILSEGIGIEEPISWRSNQQMMGVLYGVMQIKPILKRNAKGQMRPTVDKTALDQLCIYYTAEPICNHLRLLRDLDKKRQFLEKPLDPNGRFLTSLNPAGTNTGRLSSAESVFDTGGNTQNIDRRLREIFIPDKGFKFGNFDLEQADSRNLGAMCWEAFHTSHGKEFAGSYLDACESEDLHTLVARIAIPTLAWGSKPDREIADTMADTRMTHRDRCKRLGHGTNYIGQPRTMSKHTNIPVGDVSRFQINYFEAFPCIPLMHKHIADLLRATQSITTLFGRRRYFFDRIPLKSLINLGTSSTMREAVAYGPQSMTAEQINIGLLRVWRKYPEVQLLLQVHDSILLQYPEELEDVIIPEILALLKVTLSLTAGRKFTVPVEAKIGWNYGDVSYDSKTKKTINPSGLKKWKGKDKRKRPKGIIEWLNGKSKTG